MKRIPKTLVQLEFAPVAKSAFNLASESGEDPLRLTLEALRKAEAVAAAREYELKMQRTFGECPGFLGGDVPSGLGTRGYVILDPAKVPLAVPWLRRRFHVAEEMEFDRANSGLRVAVMARERKAPGVRRKRVNLRKPEQFTLGI